MTEHNPVSQQLAVAAAAVQQELPGVSDEQGWRKLSKLSPILRSGLAIAVLSGFIIANLRDVLLQPLYAMFDPEYGRYASDFGYSNSLDFVTDVQGGLLILGGFLLAVVLVVALVSWLQWRFAMYRVTVEQVELRRGMLFKQQRIAPLGRIQNIDIERKLLARLFGLSAVKITTAGGSFALEFLSRADAEVVREQLLHLSRAVQLATVAPAAPHVPTPPGTAATPASAFPEAAQVPPAPAPEAGLQSRLGAHLDGILAEDIDPRSRATGSITKVPPGRLIGSLLLAPEAVAVAVFMVLAMSAAFFSHANAEIAPWVGGMTIGWLLAGITMVFIAFDRLNKSWNYTISAADGEARIGAGLTTTKTESVPIKRITSVEITQPLLWRPLGWYEIKFFSAGGTEMVTGKTHNALPVGTLADVSTVLELLLPGRVEPQVLKEALKRGTRLRYGAVRRAAPLVVLSARNEGGALLGVNPAARLLLSRAGLLYNRIGFTPLERAQAVVLKAGPLHTLLQLRRVEAVKNGVGRRSAVRGLRPAEAHTLYTEMREAQLAAQLAAPQRAAALTPQVAPTPPVPAQPAPETLYAPPVAPQQPAVPAPPAPPGSPSPPYPPAPPAGPEQER